MKYHGAEILPKHEDLGYNDRTMDKVYEVYKDGEFKGVAWTLGNAKEFVDSNFDESVLC